MQAVYTLLQKLTTLSKQEKLANVEIDLMLDYTRQLYDNLLALRSEQHTAYNENLVFAQHIKMTEPESGNHDKLEEKQSVTETRPHKDIRDAISINDKYQLMSVLFGNNKELYEQKMAALSKLDTLDNALDWITQNKEQYKWDENGVLLLHYIVSRFFSAM